MASFLFTLEVHLRAVLAMVVVWHVTKMIFKLLCFENFKWELSLFCKVSVGTWSLSKQVACPQVCISLVNLVRYRNQVNSVAALTHFAAQVCMITCENSNSCCCGECCYIVLSFEELIACAYPVGICPHTQTTCAKLHKPSCRQGHSTFSPSPPPPHPQGWHVFAKDGSTKFGAFRFFFKGANQKSTLWI